MFDVLCWNKNFVYACTDRSSSRFFVICKELWNWADKVDISKDKYSWWYSNAHLHFSFPLCISHSHQFDTYHTVRNKVIHFHPNIKHMLILCSSLESHNVYMCLACFFFFNYLNQKYCHFPCSICGICFNIQNSTLKTEPDLLIQEHA